LCVHGSASGRDRISLSRKLSCQDFIWIPPYVSILPAVPRQLPVLAERITHPPLNHPAIFNLKHTYSLVVSGFSGTTS